ncbi:hypothetical protein [Moraxella oblonga]|uniref:hypothetical protein n=1 Tax=Moraxella oblonga TaxID=200413 RepID=UPI00082B70D5|nr:hypothetical protein [Moraxella oblonga]
MKKSLLIWGLVIANMAIANAFNELSESELLPANDGYYGCYIYDKYKIIGSMNKNGLFIDNVFFKLTSKKDLLELGENKGKTAIYTYQNNKLTFYRAKKATFNDGVIHYSVKMTYQKTNLKPKTYHLLVECGA